MPDFSNMLSNPILQMPTELKFEPLPKFEPFKPTTSDVQPKRNLQTKQGVDFDIPSAE